MKHTNIIHNHECVSLWVRKSLTGFGCISGWRSGVPDAICMRAGPRDEKYVEISHSPPGWHVMCNKTEFMFPQNLNTFLAGTVPRGSGLRRNLNKKSSATLAVNCTQLRRAGAREYKISFIWCDCAPVCGELWTCHPDHGASTGQVTAGVASMGVVIIRLQPMLASFLNIFSPFPCWFWRTWTPAIGARVPLRSTPLAPATTGTNLIFTTEPGHWAVMSALYWHL